MKGNILAVNSVRFLAAILVFFHHLIFFLVANGYTTYSATFFTGISKYGYLGVDLFFIISGFVIALSSEGKSIRDFVSSRFIRLFPVFWLCVAVTTCFSLFFSLPTVEKISLFRFVSNLTMMPTFLVNEPHIDGVYWTLFVELKFYLAILFFMLCAKVVKIRLWAIALPFAILALIDILFYNPYSVSYVNNFMGVVFHYYFEGWMHYFLAGILFHELYKNKKKYVCYVGIFACFVVAILRSLDYMLSTQSVFSSLLNPSIVVFFVTSYFVLFLLISLRIIQNSSFLFLGRNAESVLIYLGAITYPLYLLHSKITYHIIHVAQSHSEPLYFTVALIVVIISGLVVWVNKFDVMVRTVWKKISW